MHHEVFAVHNACCMVGSPAPMQVQIVGTVLRHGPNQLEPVVGVTVVGYELRTGVKTSAAVTAPEGTFRILADVTNGDATYAFVVTDAGRVVLDTGRSLTWSPPAAGASAEAVQILLHHASNEAPVFGTLRTSQGQPSADVSVRLWRVKLDGSAEQLQACAGTTTNAAGEYAFQPIGRDLLVFVDADVPPMVARSDHRIGGGQIDLTAVAADSRGAIDAKGPAEYDELKRLLAPLIAELAHDPCEFEATVATLTQDQVALICARIGLEPETVVRLVRAARISRRPTGAPYCAEPLALEFVYALAREGIPMTWEEFLSRFPDFQSAIAGAVSKNVVVNREAVFGSNFARQIELVAKFVRRRIEDSPVLAAARGTILDADDAAIIAATYLEHHEDAAAMWAAARTQLSGDGAAKIRALQDALRIDIVTEGDASLIASVLADRGSAWATVRELATKPVGYWVGKGASAADAARIRDRLAGGYPTMQVTSDLAEADPTLAPLRDFVEATPAYEMSVRPLRLLFAESPDLAPTEPGARETLLAKAEPIERLSRISGGENRARNVAVLRELGYSSALQVVRRGRGGFVAEVGERLDDAAAAAGIFDSAMHAHALSVMMASSYAPGFSIGASGFMAAPKLPTAAAADWSEVFGSLDYCTCEDCQSVLSPAAYLVDLLQFLRARPTGKARTAFDALEAFESPKRPRRPDIADIPLTCANTNTAMPQIDLVNEVLERAVAPLGAPPPDTTRASNELLMHPEHLHVAAYRALLVPVFPFALPYDLWLDEVRSYLRAMGSSRLAVCEALGSGPNDGEVVRERLGLTALDVAVVRDVPGAPTTAQLWGVTALGATLAPVLTAMSRAGLSYEELLIVLDTGFVRSEGAAATIAFPGHGCDLEDAKLEGTWGDEMARRLARFERLRRRSGLAVADLDRVLVHFATLPSPPERNAISDRALEALSTIRSLATSTGEPVSEVIAWELPLDTRRETDGRSQYERVFVDPARETTHPLRLNEAQTALHETSRKILDATRMRVLPWAPSTAYALDARVSNRGNIYVCTNAGTSASSGGPTATGSSIVDGSCTWSFVSVADFSDLMPELTRALGLRAPQVVALASRLMGSAASLGADLGNLSALYRYVSIARALGLSIESYLLWIDILGYELETWSRIVEAEQYLRSIRAMGATVEEVGYLLRAPASSLEPSDKSISTFLTALRSDLRKIADLRDAPSDLAEGYSDKLRGLLRNVFPPKPEDVDPSAVPELLRRIIERTAASGWSDPSSTEAAAALEKHLPRFMTATEVKDAKDRLLPGSSAFASDLTARYEYIIPLLAQAIRYQQSVAAVVDAVAAATGASTALSSVMLVEVLHEEGTTRPAIETFLALRDLDDIKDDRVLAQQRVVATFRRIHKLARVLGRVGLNEDDLRKIAPFVELDAIPVRSAAVSTTTGSFLQPAPGGTVSVTLNSTAWVGAGKVVYVAGAGHYRVSSVTSSTAVVLTNLGSRGNAPPASTITGGKSVTSAIAADFALWRFLQELGDWQAQSGGKIVDLIVSASLSSPPSISTLIAKLAEAIGVPEEDLKFLASREVFGFDTIAELTDFVRRALVAVKVLRPLGVPAATAALWRAWPTEADVVHRARAADAARDAASARIPESQRVAALQPVRNSIRERQRDALVWHRRANHPESADVALVSVDVLSTELLIDIATTAAVQTSRIKQAVSSIQSLVQNAALNNEAEIVFAPGDLRHWQWMKNYRVWEANRKVFLWPENWIEPELRDDKTEFFRELETALLQDELTEEKVEESYLAYLRKLDEVSQLQIAAMCHQTEQEVGADTLHVFGVTFSEPHQYFWRRRVNGEWDGWQKLDVGIEGRHLAAAVHGRRLHLFWPIIEEKPLAGPEEGKPPPAKYVAMKLARVSYFAGAWSQKEVTEWPLPLNWGEAQTSALVPGKVADDDWRAGVGRLALWPVRDGDDLFIAIVRDEPELAEWLPTWESIDSIWPKTGFPGWG